jgi:hypothetical protein
MNINYKDFSAVGPTAQQMGPVPASLDLVNTWLNATAKTIKVINLETLFDVQSEYAKGIRVWYTEDGL